VAISEIIRRDLKGNGGRRLMDVPSVYSYGGAEKTPAEPPIRTDGVSNRVPVYFIIRFCILLRVILNYK
jgi:hypothetical protein